MMIKHPVFAGVVSLCSAVMLCSCGDDEQQQKQEQAAPQRQEPTEPTEPTEKQVAPAPSVQPAKEAPIRQSAEPQLNTAELLEAAAKALETQSPEGQKKAFELYAQVAARNNAEALYRLGCCYEGGIGTTKDAAQALDSFLKAAALQYGPAISHAALMYHRGSGTTRDVAKAEELYRKAAGLGDPTAKVLLAYIVAEDSARLPEAVECLRQAQDEPHAVAALGVMMLRGEGGLTADAEGAVALFRKAADQGNADAMCNLAYCLEQGLGVEKDEAAAVELYQKAVKSGQLVQAKYNLALCYLNGRGVAKDASEAMPLLVDATNAGHADATCELARCCMLGIGVPQDDTKALELCARAALLGSAEAQFTMYRLYTEGKKVPQNKVLAQKCLQTAAENGHSEAQRLLKK